MKNNKTKSNSYNSGQGYLADWHTHTGIEQLQEKNALLEQRVTQLEGQLAEALKFIRDEKKIKELSIKQKFSDQEKMITQYKQYRDMQQRGNIWNKLQKR